MDLCGVDTVPAEIQCMFIQGGYRPVNLGFKRTLRSLFRCHNETFNIWTHLLSLLYFLYWFCHKDVQTVVTGLTTECAYPMYAHFVGICVVFGASSFAHWFNSVSPAWHNVCFMIDYSGISFYGGCATIAFYYYNYQMLPAAIQKVGTPFILLVVVAAVFAMWLSCLSRVFSSKSTYITRTSVFAIPFVLGSLPPLYRFITSIGTILVGAVDTSTSNIDVQGSILLDSTVSNSSSIHVQGQGMIGYTDAEFCYFYCKHLIFISFAAAINVVKLPESKYPGHFDIIGHSHQWFHILIFMALRENYWLTVDDIGKFLHRSNLKGHQEQPMSPAALSLCYSVLVSSLICILVWYGNAIRRKQTKVN